MIEIKKDTIIGDILDVAPQTAPIFLSIGMHCLGCPSSRGETVEEACMVHGVDVDKLLALVDEVTKKTKKKPPPAAPARGASFVEDRFAGSGFHEVGDELLELGKDFFKGLRGFVEVEAVEGRHQDAPLHDLLL